MSHATAISLGLVNRRMYRGAVNRCVNLLVHYAEGCSANCAYCGLAKKRPGTYQEKSFIHVDWPIYSMDEIIQTINQRSLLREKDVHFHDHQWEMPSRYP